jgi:small subunit ribosomal protein S20
MKQNEVRRDRNIARRSSVKTQVRKFLDALQEKNIDAAKDEYRKTTKMLDQSASKGTLHRNMVARKKSRLAARLNSLIATSS